MNNYFIIAGIVALVMLPMFIVKLIALSKEFKDELEEILTLLLSFLLYLIMVLFWPVTLLYFVFYWTYAIVKRIKG